MLGSESRLGAVATLNSLLVTEKARMIVTLQGSNMKVLKSQNFFSYRPENTTADFAESHSMKYFLRTLATVPRKKSY